MRSALEKQAGILRVPFKTLHEYWRYIRYSPVLGDSSRIHGLVKNHRQGIAKNVNMILEKPCRYYVRTCEVINFLRNQTGQKQDIR